MIQRDDEAGARSKRYVDLTMRKGRVRFGEDNVCGRVAVLAAAAAATVASAVDAP